MDQHISFNGKSYRSVDDMPPEVRRAYEKIMGLLADDDQDGLPDAFEGLSAAGSAHVELGAVNIFYEGRHYDSVDDLPAEARRKYQQAMRRLDADQDGIPDVAEGFWSGAATPAGSAPARPPARLPLPPRRRVSPRASAPRSWWSVWES